VCNWKWEGTSFVVIMVKWLEREKQKLHTEVLRRGLFGSNNTRGQEKKKLIGWRVNTKIVSNFISLYFLLIKFQSNF
jgi:hypothetical protein